MIQTTAYVMQFAKLPNYNIKSAHEVGKIVTEFLFP